MKNRLPRVPQPTRDALEGPERFCRRCDEWWPDDAEFWRIAKKGTHVCRACLAEWNRQRYERVSVDPDWRKRKNDTARRTRERRREALAWAYQKAGALMAAGQPPDQELLDVLSRLASGEPVVFIWPAVVKRAA